jgi:nitroreductase
MTPVAATMKGRDLVDERAFPQTGTLEEQFHFLVRYAILAPSTFNTQPWKFLVTTDGIQVFVDYARRMPVADPGNRELIMSAGAAIMNLRVAAARFNLQCAVAYNYSGASEDPVAELRLSPAETHQRPHAGLVDLFGAMTFRHTSRKSFLVSRVPSSVLTRLQQLEEGSEASMLISTDGELNTKVADLIAEADRTRMSDPAYRHDIAEWLRPGVTPSRDGLPGDALGQDERVAAVNSWATKVIDPGKQRAAQDRNLCIQAPALVAICGEDAIPYWLAAGELLEKVLLFLTREGLFSSYFNSPVQIPALRIQLRKLLGAPSWPHLLLRIGYSLNEPVLTPRRPLEDFLMSAPTRFRYDDHGGPLDDQA